MPPFHVGVAISIHALREESDGDRIGLAQQDVISIHALREESDFAAGGGHMHALDFNPRSP